ncbi:MAG: peptidase S10 [Chloroflexi bacterium]|nr:MAG: peptidase S10 [Chloroflexota bacterium]
MTEETKPEEEKKPEGEESKPVEPPPDRESTSEGTVTIGRTRVPYRAVAGTYTMKEEDGTPKATFFYVSYTRTGVRNASQRPVTFAFNGGPGSSSVWLHMGLFGPRRVPLGDADTPPAPPYRAIENEFSILDLSDLVMIDPVSTGFSRPVKKDEAKEFHGLEEDTESVGEFIRLWTSRNQRWESPKFVMGESYGTTRAASLAGHLTDKLGMYVNGVVLISTILLFQTARPDPGNDLPYVLMLPTYAATAWYHGLLDRRRWKTVRSLTDEVESFALGDYASFLMRDGRTSDSERTSVAERLARYSGLDLGFVERCDLRVSPQRFFKELLRGRRRTTGRLDTRYTGIDRDAAGEQPEYDPAYSMIQGIYTAAINDYIRRDLGFDSDLIYDIISEKVRPWKWGEQGDGKYPEVVSPLRSAMNRNRRMRVLVASGYYDLATPYCAAEWTFDHMQLDAELRGNLSFKRYEAGHMMYVHEPSIRQLRRDLGEFVEHALRS